MRPLVLKRALLPALLLPAAAVAAVGAGTDRHSPAAQAASPERLAAPVQFDAQYRRRGGELPPHSFYFTRAQYSGGGWGWRSINSWATDFPKADIQFLTVLKRLSNIDAYSQENAVRLDDPNLRRYPFLYALEVGFMNLTEAEVQGLRDYLLAGGFLMIDDFWGTEQWRNFEREIRRVLPEYPIVELQMDHPIFSAMYTIDEIVQVPTVDRGVRGLPTYEQDGYVPYARGIFDENGRLLVFINWNTDIGDAWEHAEHPLYPLKFSTYAFEIGTNAIVYAMTH